jgi:SRSO17 transposase
MIERAILARVPFTWVAADTVYGVGDIENVALLNFEWTTPRSG